ncbi:MAG: glycogen/starch synthase [Saprospiraceae bacterium]
MKVLHISMECYPAAKYGGLGDVVGALPIYLNRQGLAPRSLCQNSGQTPQPTAVPEVFSQHIKLGNEYVWFSIEEVTSANLGFPLYVANIPGNLTALASMAILVAVGMEMKWSATFVSNKPC